MNRYMGIQTSSLELESAPGRAQRFAADDGERSSNLRRRSRKRRGLVEQQPDVPNMSIHPLT